ncbi:MAG TPA: hypothetical protein VN930_05165, partial [Xanthobacteraceae bacterium]|nr:hypothetical protein [Xanthobacteraceae bacterium]
MADDPDLVAAHLIAVADAAMTDEAAPDRALQVRQRGLDVHNAGGEDHRVREQDIAVDRGGEAAAVAGERRDRAVFDGGAVFLRLPRHAGEELRAGDAVGKARVVV